MNARAVFVGLLACLVLAGCGESTGSASNGEPFTLPVGPTEWDVSAPAWFHDGTLHVGERTVELGDRVDQFVLGATGVYWVRAQTLMFTNAEGDTQEFAVTCAATGAEMALVPRPIPLARVPRDHPVPARSA